MGEIVNPYIAGAPVIETKMFFGREDVFDWIQNNLSGRYVDHILVVHGQRRVGKTSVLKQLGNHLPEHYIPIFFDLQGRTHTTLDRFFWWLAREIVRVLKQDRNIELPLPEKDTFIADPEYFESQFLPSLRPILGDHVLLLTFDEFDNLEESEVKEELARPLIDYFRRLINNRTLNFIFSIGSSGRKLENMQASYTEFFKAALYKKISFLTREQTQRLVTQPVEGVLEYDRGAVEKIYETSFGHPYFTQLICHELFSLCQQTGQRNLTRQDVESILDDVIERGTVNLKFTWDEASDLEKWALAALAHSQRSDQHSLAEFLRKQRVRFINSDLNSALLHLVEKDILTPDYHFVIQLLKRWLQKNRPLEQVREELTEVNPIANRYIEIGLEFKNSGLYDKAIESFREALAVDSDNIQAQVSLAQIYLDQKAFEKAVDEFEKALAIDDEDVIARSGLCEAHLAIGDISMKKGRTREAIQSYQRVLGINAEHTDARQRMAELSQQRAERALKDGREEEAQSSFSEALKYTPEDPNLIARVKAVNAEKRARELSGLMARSRKEADAEEWNAAIATLEQAIRLAPEDPTLSDRLASIKAAARKARLEKAKAQALKSEETGRWEEALIAWNEYLSIEPGDLMALTAVERINAQHQQERLEALKTRAYTLAKSEKYAESLAVWEEYQQLKPDEIQTIQLEMEKIKKKQNLSRTYTEAQAAFAQKEYERATRLFKEVVLQDEDYKDASRRMAESVELRRTTKKGWQTKWLWVGLGLVILIILGWFSYKPLSAWLSSRPLETVAATQTLGTANPVEPTAPPTLGPATPLPTATAVTPRGPFVWTQLSGVPFGGIDAVTDIVVDGGINGKIYISTANSGIYRSIDGGNSWQSFQNGLGSARIDDLAIDLTETRTIYAVTNDGNVHKSTDNGKSWILVHQTLDLPWFPYQLAIASWANHPVFESGNGGLYRSDDGGQTWHVLNGNVCPHPVVAFALHPSQEETLFAANFTKPDDPSSNCSGGIYKSTDGGISWKPIGMQGFYGVGEGGLIVGGANGEIMYANGIDASRKMRAFRSDDGGYTWQPILDGGCFPFRVNPSDPNQVYCRDGASALVVSNDGGKKWQTHHLMESNDSFPSLAVYNDGKNILIGGKGMFASVNGGKDWEKRSSGLGDGHLELKWDPDKGLPLYLQDGICLSPGGHRLSRSEDGQEWEEIEVDYCDLAFDAGSLIMYRNGIRSSDGGKNWTKMGVEWFYSLVATPLSGELVGATQSGAIWRATSYRGAWSKIFEGDLGRYPRLFFDRSGTIFYANASYRFFEAGKNWLSCGKDVDGNNGLLTTLADQVIAVDPRNSDHLYAATSKQGIVKSMDGCRTWQSLTGAGIGAVNALVIDPQSPDTIYAATDSGAYVSFDSGMNWGQTNEGLMASPVVYSLAVIPGSGVYAATPYGIFKLETK